MNTKELKTEKENAISLAKQLVEKRKSRAKKNTFDLQKFKEKYNLK